MSKMPTARLVAGLVVLALAGAAWAQLPAPQTPPPGPSVPVGEPPTGVQATDCRESSNGCQVCLGDVRSGRCSMPGIACQPSAWRCIKPQAASPDSPPAEVVPGR